MRNFVSISARSTDAGECYIGTNTDHCFYMKRVKSATALDFLYSLHTLKQRKALKNPVYVWYNSRIIVEQLLRDLPEDAKDILFPSKDVCNERKEWNDFLRDCVDGKCAECVRARARLSTLEYVYYNNYRIRLRAGKSLTISKRSASGKAEKGVTIYDLYNFFDKASLASAAKRFLNEAGAPALPENMVSEADANAETLARLARVLSDYLEAFGVTLKRWYGPSSVVNTLLRRWNVKSDFRRISANNTAPLLYHGINCAFYGGRIEAIVLGTVYDVYVYDLNSAFAYAVTLLPKLNKTWHYTREYNTHEPFALWHVKYELPANAALGILPHRQGNGSIIYKRRGSGWYYAPEVRELARRFPDLFTVSEGYTVACTPVSFAGRVREVYDRRLGLIAREGKGKGERIYKAILQQFYGKFSQTLGSAPYLCLPWAGWITSFVRAQMLEAVAGQEHNVLYLHTDAIHSLAPLAAPRVSEHLGEWSSAHYPAACYLGPGVHCFYDEEKRIIKSSTRGFKYIDFDAAIKELNNPRSFGRTVLKREFFAGWQYQSAFPLREEYLTRVKETLALEPQSSRVRRFQLTGKLGPNGEKSLGDYAPAFDWGNTYVTSRMVDIPDERESGPRRERDFTSRLDYMIDI